MSPQARMAAGQAPVPVAGESAADASGVGPFVINLVSSTTPMALSHPDLAELKRFSFFVSRRREDNRERFRLHMGYFASLAEAEEWLNIVRDIYPGAWAGEAPGKKLRARAAAAALANELPTPPAPPTAPNPAVVRVTAKPVAVAKTSAPAVAAPVELAPAEPALEIVVPTLQAAAPLAPPPQPVSIDSTARLMAPVLATLPRTEAPTASATPPKKPAQPPRQAATRAPAAQPAKAVAPAAPAKQAAAALVAPAKQQAAAPITVVKPAAPAPKRPDALSGSNVREVMAQLDETGETRQMLVPNFPASSAPPAAARTVSPSASAAPSGRPSARAAAPAAPTPRAPVAAEQPRANAPAPRAPVAADSGSSMSDTQVLRFLEQRRDSNGERAADDAGAGISLLKPDDTQTRLALKDAVRDNAPVSFAVQLFWSVQPVDLRKVPPLAIFSAYTLYTVEGSREGRKWYGLRLGFFSDAISAKQVAQYVRSEFSSVAVVPVSPQEKTRASAEETKAATGSFAKKAVLQARTEEFKLFDDEPRSIAPEAPAPPKPAAAAAAGKSSPARKGKPLGRVRASEKRSAKTLEETLEILGASDLEIDIGRGELLNDTGVRHLRVEVQKNTAFSKLLTRLSERVRGS